MPQDRNHLVGPRGTDAQPPRQLGEHGMRLWRTVPAEYAVDDCGGREMLAQACAGLDRAEPRALARRRVMLRSPGIRFRLGNRRTCSWSHDRDRGVAFS